MTIFSNRRELWWGLAGLAAVLAVFFTLALLGWPGAADSCTRDVPNTCWCERFVRPSALIKQPTNTWGNLGFFVVGLAILWQVGGDRAAPAARRNPMTTASPYALGYAVVGLFLGPGSMFFHASIAVALVIWALSQTGRPLCDPESWFQGHAVWHLLSAAVAGCAFLYLRTERT